MERIAMKNKSGRITVPIAKIPKLETRSPRDVFVLFAALNAMGYDEENNAKGMAPARKKVRGVLLGYNWNEKYPGLKRAFQEYGPWHILNAILAKPKNAKKTSMLGGCLQDLGRFSKEPLVRELWPIVKARQTRDAKKLFPLFQRETSRLIAFISRLPKRVKKIALIVNPLDAYWRGYGFGVSVGFWSGLRGISYVIVGPGAEKNQGELIRHELLHILAPALQIPRRIVGRNRKRMMALGYGSPRIINREYVVRGLNFLYEKEVLERNIAKDIQREAKDFPHINDALVFLRTEMKKAASR